MPGITDPTGPGGSSSTVRGLELRCHWLEFASRGWNAGRASARDSDAAKDVERVNIWSRSTPALLVTGLVLVLTGSSGQAALPAEKVKATDRSMAAVVLRHVDTTRRPGLIGPLQGKGNGFANAEVRYGVSGESPSPGRTIQTLTAVYRERPKYVDRAFCRSDDGQNFSGCRSRELRNGSTLIVFWTEFTPEEDPGSVGFLRLDKRGACSVVFFSGRPIKGDPAKRDLANRVVSFRELRAVARDPRLSWRTTKHMVTVGSKLPHWGAELKP